MTRTFTRRKGRESGSAVVELALMAPWIFFLFVGVFDFGFYAYAVICTENAARAAAIQTAANLTSQTDRIACNAVWNEMRSLPNVAQLPQDCTQLPVKVVRRTLCITGSVSPSSISCDAPGCADCGSDPAAASSQVAVSYQTNLFVPIPGILTNQLALTRIVEMRIIAK